MTQAAETPDHLRATASMAAPIAPISPLLPQPPELKPDVDFWIRVYTEISANEGFLHDQRNLAVVYEKLSFPAELPPRDRQAQVDQLRQKYQQILNWLASGASPRDAEDQRVRDLWSQETGTARLLQAANDVRFQLGQSDRFRAGLERAGRWEAHIARTLAAQGLPPELAVLPHVESSFDSEAYSKVGAAGLWQFMRPTGRRYLRIDTLVDERMDPFRATEAAAQLLNYNYHVLGSWPLAITAYNYGAEGMRRAREKQGSDDIVKLVREYTSPIFGFASRNFYVSFLAALTVDRQREHYFPGLKPLEEARAQEIPLQSAVGMDVIEGALGNSRSELRALNPALRDPVWSGAKPVPAGYRLRLPLGIKAWTAESLSVRLAAAGRERASATGAATASAATSTAAAAAAAAAAAVGTPAARAQVAQAVEDARTQQRERATAGRVPEAVSANEARSQGPSLLPGAEAALSADALDYAVADNGSIRVAADETLGHFADWLTVPTATLRTLNALRDATPLRFGQRLRLDFSHATREQFETRRRDYHQGVQAAYFATRRIAGTETYTTQRGDTLYSLAQRSNRLPLWLLQQYNPDVDLLQLRAGLQIVLPKVEARPDV